MLLLKYSITFHLLLELQPHICIWSLRCTGGVCIVAAVVIVVVIICGGGSISDSVSSLCVNWWRWKALAMQKRKKVLNKMFDHSFDYIGMHLLETMCLHYALNMLADYC